MEHHCPGAGLATCTLQVRLDDGDWQLYSQQCAGTESFDAQPGHTYTFRLTATDNVGNEAQTEAGAFTTAVTKYYYFGSKRVAMRGPDDAVVWLHGDHLGSTSLATDAAQAVVSRQLYYPFGGTRWTSVASLPTDFQFTGQRIQSKIALYDYHARFYDPYLNRFIQADTIVPEPGNPQHFNRYSYVLNNPLKFTDPSGHQCTIEYDPFTGSYGGKSCFGDQTGMGQTLAVDWEHGGAGGCQTAAECKAAEDRLVKLLWFLGTVSFLGPAIAEAAPAFGIVGTGAAAAELACMDDDCTNEASKAVELGAQAVEVISADGDPLNEIGAARDVALGLARASSGEKLLQPWADEMGALTNAGWIKAGLAEEGPFVQRFYQALYRSVSGGGRIKFNLSGLDLGRALSTPRFSDPFDVGMTNWELQQILNNKFFFEATDFFIGDLKLTAEQAVELGLIYLGG